MKLYNTQYSIRYDSLALFVTGCDAQPKCSGCHNQDLWNFDIEGAKQYNNEYKQFIKDKIDEYEDTDMVKKLMIMGGDPMDQELDELQDLLQFLNEEYPEKSLWLWTRFLLEDIPEFIKDECDYIKTGRYKEELPEKDTDFNMELASSNQKIHKV